MKLVTVIVPIYGVEGFIASTIETVLNQTYQNFELLLIDDGSPDRSIEICRTFNDSRIRILQQQNRGPAAARNLGIQAAKGDYIALLDGDDLWLPDKLEKHVQHLESSPQVGVSFCRSAFIDEQSQPLGIFQITKLNNISILDLMCRTPIGNGSVPVFRKATFEAIAAQGDFGFGAETYYFNPDRRLHPSEDVECWLRVALTTEWKIEGIPEPLTLYRVTSGSCSAKLLKKLNSWEFMLQDVARYAPQEMAPCVAPAMAYQLRHLARRAVTLRDGAAAVDLIHQALKTHPRILTEEFYRTGQTIAAAYLLRILPSGFYRQFETLGLRVAGLLQKQRISKEAAVQES
jgi:hypothetical protein